MMKSDLPPIKDVLTIAKMAGDAIMDMRETVVRSAQIKGDGSPVTEADKRASAIVIEGLGALTPHIPVISEERDDAENKAIQAAHDRYWIVDPLDGTRSYINGHDGFGVHIGLIDNGVPVAGVIWFPAQGVAYYTDGDKAFIEKDGQPPRQLRVDTTADDTPRTAMSWVANRQPAQSDVAHVAVPAVGGARVCVVAEGDASLALIEAPFSYWDIAAAHAVLRAAGGDLFNLATGEPTRYPKGKLDIEPSIGGDAHVVAKHRPAFKAAVEAAWARLSAPRVFKPKI